MEVGRLLSEAKDSMTVRRVFGEPYEADGVTVIPAAAVQGGGGGGEGRGGKPGHGGAASEPMGEGSGGGFGVNARPVGAYVIKGGQVSWVPALDLNRAILGGQVVAIVLLLTLRAIFRRR